MPYSTAASVLSRFVGSPRITGWRERENRICPRPTVLAGRICHSYCTQIWMCPLVYSPIAGSTGLFLVLSRFGTHLSRICAKEVRLAFYLTARSADVGFTFNSRNFGNMNAQPLLLITAVANPHARIDTIAPAGTNVSISFAVVSNWTYTLQGTCETQDASSGWSNLMVVAPQ